MTDPLRPFRKLAQANRLANARLHRTCALLPPAELTARRPAFFGSIQATLNHILLVDRFYLNALEGQRLNRAALDEARACPDLLTLTRWQAETDDRLIAHVDGLADFDLAVTIEIDRGERVQKDRRDDILLHLLTHQVHHRGQIHDMLSATPIKPPQLDEFFTADDYAARVEDMLLLDWSEADLMR
jgi:uncharacterized damage-inducible protein DinB